MPRPPRYGVRTEKVSAWFWPDLIAALDRDVLAENARAGDHDANSRSSRIARFVAERLNVPIPQPTKEVKA